MSIIIKNCLALNISPVCVRLYSTILKHSLLKNIPYCCSGNWNHILVIVSVIASKCAYTHAHTYVLILTLNEMKRESNERLIQTAWMYDNDYTSYSCTTSIKLCRNNCGDFKYRISFNPSFFLSVNYSFIDSMKFNPVTRASRRVLHDNIR